MSFRRPDFFIGELPKDAADRAELARKHRVLPPNATDEYDVPIEQDTLRKIQSSRNPNGERYSKETYATVKSDEYVWWPEGTIIDEPDNLRGPYAHVSIETNNDNNFKTPFIRFIPTDTTLNIIGIDGADVKPDFLPPEDGKEPFVSTDVEGSWFDLLKCTGTVYTATNISHSYYKWARYFGPPSTVKTYVDSYLERQGITNVHKTEMNGTVMFDTQSWWNVWKMLVYGAMRYNATRSNDDAWLALLKMPQNTPNRYLSLFREFKRLVDSSEFSYDARPRDKNFLPNPNDMETKIYGDNEYFARQEGNNQKPEEYMKGICDPCLFWPHEESLDFAVAHFGDGPTRESNDLRNGALLRVGVRPRKRNDKMVVLKKWFGKMSDEESGWVMSLQRMAAAFEADETQQVALRGKSRGPIAKSFYKPDTAFDVILYSLIAEHGLPFSGKIQPTTEYYRDKDGGLEVSKRCEGAFYDVFPGKEPPGTKVSTDYQVTAPELFSGGVPPAEMTRNEKGWTANLGELDRMFQSLDTEAPSDEADPESFSGGAPQKEMTGRMEGLGWSATPSGVEAMFAEMTENLNFI